MVGCLVARHLAFFFTHRRRQLPGEEPKEPEPEGDDGGGKP